MAVFEVAEEICNEEATKHQAHGQQGSVGVGPFKLQLVNGYIAVWMVLDMLLDDWVEGVIHRSVQMLIVQNQRMCLEDLRGEVRGSKARQKQKK